MVLQMGANGASCQEPQIAPKNRFHTNFFDKIMELPLLIFTLETNRFCMKCIEFTVCTYNFKNLAVGSLIWGAKTGVNSSYFPQKFSTYVPCSLLHIDALDEPRRLGLLGASKNKNKYIF
jgi:hypothetical protein